jgi:hypothetical protein
MRSSRLKPITNPYARTGTRKKLSRRKSTENRWTPLTNNEDDSSRLPRVKEVMVNEKEMEDEVSPLSSRQSTKGSHQQKS